LPFDWIVVHQFAKNGELLCDPFTAFLKASQLELAGIGRISKLTELCLLGLRKQLLQRKKRVMSTKDPSGGSKQSPRLKVG
jgi:hypothetical protein